MNKNTKKLKAVIAKIERDATKDKPKEVGGYWALSHNGQMHKTWYYGTPMYDSKRYFSTDITHFYEPIDLSHSGVPTEDEIVKQFPESNDGDPNNGIEDDCYAKREGAKWMRSQALPLLQAQYAIIEQMKAEIEELKIKNTKYLFDETLLLEQSKQLSEKEREIKELRERLSKYRNFIDDEQLIDEWQKYDK